MLENLVATQLKKIVAEEIKTQLRASLTENVAVNADQNVGSRQIKTVEALCEKYDLKYVPSEAKLYCKICKNFCDPNQQAFGSGNNGQPRKWGEFSSAQPMYILNGIVKTHFASTRHSNCVQRSLTMERQSRHEKSIAMRVARLAFCSYREADSYKSFERRVYVNHLGDTPMGTINHSEKFVASFLTSVDAEVVARLSNFYAATNPATDHPPSFALIADKATLLSRTGQLTVGL